MFKILYAIKYSITVLLLQSYVRYNIIAIKWSNIQYWGNATQSWDRFKTFNIFDGVLTDLCANTDLLSPLHWRNEQTE